MNAREYRNAARVNAMMILNGTTMMMIVLAMICVFAGSVAHAAIDKWDATSHRLTVSIDN
jgi:hypothetical protein